MALQSALPLRDAAVRMAVSRAEWWKKSRENSETLLLIFGQTLDCKIEQPLSEPWNPGAQDCLGEAGPEFALIVPAPTFPS